VNLGNLLFQDGIDEAVPGKQGLASELVGNDNSLECLSTATYAREEHIVSTYSPITDFKHTRLRERSIIPERSSIFTVLASSSSSSFFWSNSAVTPEVSAMAAPTAENERAVRENGACEMKAGLVRRI
jgi:hypothetical protein